MNCGARQTSANRQSPKCFAHCSTAQLLAAEFPFISHCRRPSSCASTVAMMVLMADCWMRQVKMNSFIIFNAFHNCPTYVYEFCKNIAQCDARPTICGSNANELCSEVLIVLEQYLLPLCSQH